MTIALIGPSGAGKGTQASKLVASFDLLHVSTGDLFRQSLEKRSALGLLRELSPWGSGRVSVLQCAPGIPRYCHNHLVQKWLWHYRQIPVVIRRHSLTGLWEILG